MEVLGTFISLLNFGRGKISSSDLVSSDKLIIRVQEDRNVKGQSKVYVEFNNESDFLEAIGLHDDDIWFYNAINSPYGNFEFFEWSSIIDDFENGYGVYDELDDENIEKLSKISKLILPIKVNFDDENFRKSLSEKLLTNFKEETEYILAEYQSERNNELAESAREKIDRDLKKYFEFLYDDQLKRFLDEQIIYAMFHRLLASGTKFVICRDQLNVYNEYRCWKWLDAKYYAWKNIMPMVKGIDVAGKDPGYHTDTGTQVKIAELLLDKYLPNL